MYIANYMKCKLNTEKSFAIDLYLTADQFEKNVTDYLSVTSITKSKYQSKL